MKERSLDASLRMNTASLGGSGVEELHSAPGRTERVTAPRGKQEVRFELQLQEDLRTETCKIFPLASRGRCTFPPPVPPPATVKTNGEDKQ